MHSPSSVASDVADAPRIDAVAAVSTGSCALLSMA